MRSWLQAALANCTLPEEMEGYLFGRGAQNDRINSLGLCAWTAPESDAPDSGFSDKFGPGGKWVQGWLTCPLYAPSGELVGVEFRNTIRKRILYYMIEPESKWTPVWMGIQQAMPKIWNGSEIWVVEGLFDLCALDWVIPEQVALVSSLKARLTRSHVQFLERFAQSVCMVYDMDEAGQRGASKALFDLRKSGVLCRSLKYAGGKDPGVVWDQYGVEGLKRFFDTSYYITGVQQDV